jgi:hypothetical protein
MDRIESLIFASEYEKPTFILFANHFSYVVLDGTAAT